jgi:hypothetical protein
MDFSRSVMRSHYFGGGLEPAQTIVLIEPTRPTSQAARVAKAISRTWGGIGCVTYKRLHSQTTGRSINSGKKRRYRPNAIMPMEN